MVRWLTTFVFLFALIAGIPGGNAFAEQQMNSASCPMKCCKKKAAEKDKVKKTDVAVCRILNCSVPVPTNPGSASQLNLAPSLTAISSVSNFERLFAQAPKPKQHIFTIFPETVHFEEPIYIKQLSLLI